MGPLAATSVFCVIGLVCLGQVADLGAVEVQGLVISRDETSLQLRTAKSTQSVVWTRKTRFALLANTRLLGRMRNGRFDYPIHSSDETIAFAYPPGPITGIKLSRGASQLTQDLRDAKNERWISERGLSLLFGQTPAVTQLASSSDLRFIGTWDPHAKPRTLTIQGQQYEISMKKGGQTTIPLYGILGHEDVSPFVDQVTVQGEKRGETIVAEEIQMLPMGDQAAQDAPGLPRHLFIGDSISGNYSQSLRSALNTRFNIHHPPTNCGSSAKGVANMLYWLGAYDQPGRHWDVISFNFGHWDAGVTKQVYQANLERIIQDLKKTGAQLIWVTTCPVPNGYEHVVEVATSDRAPGRQAGVMERFLNPWAVEVMKRHRDITICDQWQFVKQNTGGVFSEWWQGKNVHFQGAPAEKLGRVLAQTV